MNYLRYFVFIILSIIALSCAVKLNNLKQKFNHYSISLNISPQTKNLNIKGSIQFVSTEPFCDSAVFYLHKQFNIKSISGIDVKGFKFYSSADTSLITNPDSRILLVQFNRQIDKGEATEINFEYSGQISQVHNLSQNIISKDWTEIGSNLPWFPYNIRHGSFTFNLTVEIDNGYTVKSSVISSNENNVFKSFIPTNDIIVIASKSIKELRTQNLNYNLRLYYSDIRDSTARKLNEDINWILNSLSNRHEISDQKNFLVLQTMNDIGGSYSRIGMISLSKIYDSTYNENRVKIFKQISSASSKLWLTNSQNNWNDWMIEGFAELSALLLIKDKFGNETFAKLIKEIDDSSLGLPPIWNFNREYIFNSDQFFTAYKIMNIKAPLLLYKLYSKIGDKRFYSLFKEMNRNRSLTAEKFLQLLAKREGEKISDWFQKILRDV